MENSNEFLSIENLHVHYVTEGVRVKAVNGVSLKLRKGEILGLVGETGAGKTSMAMAIMRLLPKYTGEVPKGNIYFQGTDLATCPEKEMQKIRGGKISMIFQDPMTSLNPTKTVGRQIEEVLRLHSADRKKHNFSAEAGKMLELVGIPAARAKAYPHQFSGGMKQRVMIAIALACKPEMIIADEPTSALDVTIQAQILNLLRTLQKETNTSTILITHDLGVVASMCDSVAVMYAGEIVEYGTLEEIFDPALPHHYYTRGLFQCVPKIHEKADRLMPIHGLMPDPSNLPDGCKFHPRCSGCQEECKAGEVKQYINGQHTVLCNRCQ